jgi:hypothetical protein
LLLEPTTKLWVEIVFKIRVALNDSKGLLSVGNVLPSLPPLKLLGFSMENPYRASGRAN